MPNSRSRVPFARATAPSVYWREADARAVLAQLDHSGLSVRGFARREGLNVQRLYRWRRALAGDDAAPVPSFVEIVGGPKAPAIEVVLPSGAVLRVPAGFDEETVRRLVTILVGAVRC